MMLTLNPESAKRIYERWRGNRRAVYYWQQEWPFISHFDLLKGKPTPCIVCGKDNCFGKCVRIGE